MKENIDIIVEVSYRKSRLPRELMAKFRARPLKPKNLGQLNMLQHSTPGENQRKQLRAGKKDPATNRLYRESTASFTTPRIDKFSNPR